MHPLQLPLVLKLPQTNRGASTYSEEALMLTANLLLHAHCKPIVKCKAFRPPLNIKIFQRKFTFASFSPKEAYLRGDSKCFSKFDF